MKNKMYKVKTYIEKRCIMMVMNKYMYDNNMYSTQWLLKDNSIEFYKFNDDVKYTEVKLNHIMNMYKSIVDKYLNPKRLK